MKYALFLIVCILLFSACHKKPKAYSFASHKDTLSVDWGVVEAAHITYYFQSAANWTDEVNTYVSEHEQVYERLDSVFKAQLPTKLRFYIWYDTALARRTLNRTLGYALPNECVCNLRPDQSLGHEMTHVLSYWANGNPPISYTRFVSEGVAVAFDLSEGAKIDRARSALEGQHFSSVRDIWINSKSIPESVLYPVAGAFMEYLYQLYIPTPFFLLLRYQTIEEAEFIYGKDHLDKIIADFDQRLGL